MQHHDRARTEVSSRAFVSECPARWGGAQQTIGCSDIPNRLPLPKSALRNDVYNGMKKSMEASGSLSEQQKNIDALGWKKNSIGLKIHFWAARNVKNFNSIEFRKFWKFNFFSSFDQVLWSPYTASLLAMAEPFRVRWFSLSSTVAFCVRSKTQEICRLQYYQSFPESFVVLNVDIVSFTKLHP